MAIQSTPKGGPKSAPRNRGDFRPRCMSFVFGDAFGPPELIHFSPPKSGTLIHPGGVVFVTRICCVSGIISKSFSVTVLGGVFRPRPPPLLPSSPLFPAPFPGELGSERTSEWASGRVREGGERHRETHCMLVCVRRLCSVPSTTGARGVAVVEL